MPSHTRFSAVLLVATDQRRPATLRLHGAIRKGRMIGVIVYASAVLFACLETKAACESDEKDSRNESGHRDRVVSVSVSSDARFVASLSADGLLIVWDAARGDVLWTRSNVRAATIPTAHSRLSLVEHRSHPTPESLSCVRCDLRSGSELETSRLEPTDIGPMAFSPNGEWLAGASSLHGGEVRNPVYLWDVGTGQCVDTRRGHSSPATAISWADDGETVLLGCADGMCLILDDDQEFPRFFSGHTESIDDIALSSDASVLLAGSRDGAICWDMSNNVVARTKHKGRRRGIVGSSPARELWCASAGERRVQVFQGTGSTHATAHLVDSVEFSCAFLAVDGDVIATGSVGGSVALWDARSGRKMRELGAKYGIPRDVVFTGASSTALVGYSANVALLWDAARSQCVRVLTGPASNSNGVLSVSCSKNGNVLAIGHYLGQSRGFPAAVHLWDADGLERIGTLQIPLSGLNMGPVRLSRDAGILVCGNGVWSTARRKNLWRFDSTHSDCVVSWCGLMGIQDYVVLAGTHMVGPAENVGFLARCETATGDLCCYRESPWPGFESGWLRTASLRDDGLELIVRGDEGWAVIDTNTLDLKRVLKLPESRAIDQVTYFDRSHVLLWCHTGDLVLFDLTKGAESLVLSGHNDPITCVDCCPLAERIVSGSLDKSVILWDSATGSQLSRFVSADREKDCCSSQKPVPPKNSIRGMYQRKGHTSN
ncbi:MAG: hypothetical protein FJ276_24600 [Planctomycetes bacterium]|nr:hypothetical protein [Planctomycetota bacterium]